MIKSLRLAFATLLLTTIVPNVSQADIILGYEGKFFTSFTGTAFSTADRITGTVTFSHIGALKAKAFSLSTTMNGLPGFTLQWDGGDLGGLVPNSNDFDDWKDSKPSYWNIYVIGDVKGSSDASEDIAIQSVLGDSAALDNLQSIGNSATDGVWTVVPEPSSIALLATGSVLGFAVLRRRRSR